MNRTPITSLVFTLICAGMLGGSTNALANPLGDTLAGQKKNQPVPSNTEESFDGEEKPKFRVRGIPSQSRTRVVAPQPKVRTETQTIYTTRGVASDLLKTRGVATAFDLDNETAVAAALQSEGKVNMKVTRLDPTNAGVGSGKLHAGTGEEVVEIKINVDPESRLKGQINFVKGEATIKDDSSVMFLNNLVDALKNDERLASEKFVIQGHASAEGSEVANLELSQSRANAIFHALRQKGVDPDTIFPVGVGEQQARFPESAPEHSRQQDRRVVIFRLED